jgi:hypothetical protein
MAALLVKEMEQNSSTSMNSSRKNEMSKMGNQCKGPTKWDRSIPADTQDALLIKI